MSNENEIETEDPVIDDNVPVDETDETLPEEETTPEPEGSDSDEEEESDTEEDSEVEDSNGDNSEDDLDEEDETVEVAGIVPEELLNLLPTASELRDTSNLNNPFNKLVERIADGLLRAANEGKYVSSYELFQDVDVDSLIQLFENQGFKVTCKPYTVTTPNSRGTYKFVLEW